MNGTIPASASAKCRRLLPVIAPACSTLAVQAHAQRVSLSDIDAKLDTVIVQQQAASDGVVAIDQDCAVNTGCLAGDAAGFPLTLTQPRSYRLTSDLTVADENTTAISVRTRDITIELNGFRSVGPVTCTQNATTLEVTCSASGQGDGISDLQVAIGTAVNTTVRNGTVRGMGRFGIALQGDNGHVEHMRAISNRLTGIGVNSLAVTRNGSVKFSCGMLDGSDGIFIGFDGLAQSNVCVSNGGDGIRANERSLALGNTMNRNHDTGLDMAVGSGYGNNVMSNNNGGNANKQVTGSGVAIGGNVCGFDANCP